MINVGLIKHQMNKMNINLTEITDVEPQIINEILSGDFAIENLQMKNYESIVNALFTPLEQSIANRSLDRIEQYEAYYKEALVSALHGDGLVIQLSDGVLEHVQVRWGYIDDDLINEVSVEQIRGRRFHGINIFDEKFYMDMKRDQSDKMKLLKTYLL